MPQRGFSNIAVLVNLVFQAQRPFKMLTGFFQAHIFS